MMPGRFFLGVGSGEALNEHILGDHWPRTPIRQEMLEEAIAVIRQLWEGGYQSWDGTYYTVEDARIYTLPEELPPIIVAASGSSAATLAAEDGDGLWSVAPQAELVDAYRQAGGSGPRYGQVTVCWAADEAEARKTAHQVWPNAGIKGYLSADLPTPKHFEQASQLATEEKVAEAFVCGNDPEQHLEMIDKYAQAGFDEVYVANTGPHYEGLFDLYASAVLPKLAR